MSLGISAPRRWLLITGMPRSGTTFAGQILSTPLRVDYLHEPFNPDCGITGVDQRLIYAIDGSPNEADLRPSVESLLRYEARLRTGYFPRDPGWRRTVKRVVGSRGPFHYRLARLNPWHEAALVKDPVGCLLLEYLVRSHGFTAALVVRHPLGVVHSFERLGWDPNRYLRALREQPWFAADHLEGEERDLLATEWKDPALGTAVLWRILHRALAAQATRTGSPIVLHEDLSAHPGPVFRDLFEHFDLTWTRLVEHRIGRATHGGRSLASRSGATQQLSRDSAAIAGAVLDATPVERRRAVWELTEPVATTWYDRASFGL